MIRSGRTRSVMPLLVVLSLPLVLIAPSQAQGIAVPNLMNFQGRLTKADGTPLANGNYALRFSLWSAATGGTEKWNQTLNPVTVRNGAFAVLLSGFPSGTFNTNLWLEIKIGTASPLSPRQQLVSVAYAFKADSVKDGAIVTASLASNAVTTARIADSSVTTPKLAAQSVTGNILADGAINGEKFAPGLLNSLLWRLNGNSGVTTGFLGTTDNNPLEFRANGWRAMRYSYAENTSSSDPAFQYRSINVLGGSDVNSLLPGITGATIGGGGYNGFLGVNGPNVVNADFGTIGGGHDHTVNGFAATIAGGIGGKAERAFATVSGGYRNVAGNAAAATGGSATVGGGYENIAGGDYATIPGGFRNAANGLFSFAGGRQAKANHHGAFVWGDASNADFATTGDNQFLIRASAGVGINTNAPSATLHVLGLNTTNGTVMLQSLKGINASHIHYGANGDWYIRSAQSNGIVALQDTGGNVGIGTSTPNRTLTIHSSGAAYVNVRGNDGSKELLIGADSGGTVVSAMTNDHLIFRSGGNVDRMIILNNGNVGIGTLSPAYTLHVNGSVAGIGNYNNLSDARYKTNVQTLDNALDVILNLRGVTFAWRRGEYPQMNFSGGRQVGFLAQEVETVLPELVSTDKNGYKSVAYANVVPVLVEAVKTLKKDNDAKTKRLTEMEARLAAVEQALAELKANRK